MNKEPLRTGKVLIGFLFRIERIRKKTMITPGQDL